MSTKRLAVMVGAFLLLAESLPVTGIPAFARKYRVTCALCHSPVPRLNAFGEAFAGNGFQFAPGEDPRDTIQTGDELLTLMGDLPLAVRLDAYLSALTDAPAGAADLDLQTPWAIKMLSGGPIAKNVSYYLYFFMSERGEVAGLEDAYVQFTDIGGSGVALMVGQFQASDPMFKRELRLEYEDYNAYRVRVGDARADLTYDRGLMAVWSPWEGGDLALQILNGRGLDASGARKTFDTDGFKNYGARFSQSFGPVRLGGYGYFATEELAGGSPNNEIVVWGPDATVSLTPDVELNGQFLRRTDSRPFFQVDDAESTVDAVVAELVWSPNGATGRWWFTGLYNRVWSDSPVFTVRQGEAGLLDEYETASASLSWLMARNLRMLGEVQYDLVREGFRLTAGFSSAF